MIRRVAVALALLIVAGCGGAPSDIRDRIATFQQNANAGRLAEIHRTYPESAKPNEYELAKRAGLGRMISTAEASVNTQAIDYGRVSVTHNTRFERGEAIETFSFKIDEKGIHLTMYALTPGKRVKCPLLTRDVHSCWREDVPVTAASR
jgi:hypothetical protein